MTASTTFRRQLWVGVGLTVIVIAALFGFFQYSAGYLDERVSIFQTLVGLWSDYPDWQHGALVPLLAAFLVWLKRKKLATVPIEGSWLGLPILLLSFAVFWVGYLIDHYYLGFAAAQIFMAGAIIWLLGLRMMWELAFPWLFLCFAWPILYFDNLIAFPLRILMTELSYESLSLMGVQCLRTGSAIVSAPNYQLGLGPGAIFAVDIANPCSGIQSLFALMMVSALFGYFTLPRIWQRIVLFLAAVPFAILGNLIRILLLTFGTLMFGSDFAIGSAEDPSLFHMMAGFFVFAIALAAMIGLQWALQADWRMIFREAIALRHSITEVRSQRSVSEPVHVKSGTSDIY